MNKFEKEVAQLGLDKEKAVKKSLEELYRNALAEINERVLILMSDELTQSKIYRIEYQKALKGHVSAILDNLKNSRYDSISEYLKGCYEDGFLGTLYNLNKSGIPMFLPMMQEQIVDAVILDSKISEGLYTRLGNDTKVLKKRISSEISRGLSTSMSYADIARNLENQSRMSINNAMNIVQTEGHRIQIRSALDSGNKASAKGADLVKVWDSTLDSKTRDHHRELDGQVRELDEDFEVDGITVSAPGQFGMPSEDCRCRCALLIKPRWDVTGSFTKRNNETGELLEFKNASDYQEFKQKYWGMVDKSGGSGIIKINKKSEWGNDLEPRGQLPSIDGDDLYSFVSKELKIDEKSAKKMTDSVMAFTDDYYIDIRSFQRGESPNAIDKIKEMAEDIETYIKKAPRWNGGETFRGCTISDDELSTYKVDTLKTMGGTASWSNLESVSMDFAKHNVSQERPNKIIFHCDTQSKGTGIKHMSVYEKEYEVICSKESMYEIFRIESDNDSNIHVYLKEV